MSSTVEVKIPKVSSGVSKSKKKATKTNYKKELEALKNNIRQHLEMNCLTGKLMCLFMELHDSEVKHVTTCIEEFRTTLINAVKTKLDSSQVIYWQQLPKAMAEAWILFKHSTEADQCHKRFLELLQTPPIPVKEVNEVIEVIEVVDQSDGYEADIEDTPSHQSQSKPSSPESPTRYFLPEDYKDTQPPEQFVIPIKQEQE